MRGQTILSMQEQQAYERAAFTLASTGMPLVFTLDPTVIRTSSYVINPLRAISRIETISGTNEWRGLTSGAVVATYESEATEAADQTPTLTQPAVLVQRAQTFVPFSREVDQDWAGVQTEMAGLFQESKDILEATQFLTGAGTTVFPQGILTGLTTSERIQCGTTGVFAVADLYNLQGAVPPRARNGNATFLASLTQLNRVRGLDTGGGGALWVQLQQGLPPSLIGMPVYELSTMTATLAGAGNKLMVVGDFATGYLIVDRIGMDIELIPHLFGASNRYPTGQRGLWAMWRNSAKVLDKNRFRYLETI
jgi:HK97 family phage major capsid protein